MNKTLQVVNEQVVLGKEFKVYGTVENPLFLAKDVATWIENSNVSQMVRNLDEGEKVKEITPIYNVYNGQHENQECLFLTEDGLYEVLMLSRKPIAKSFKKEVKAILKQLRLTGGAVVENREDEFISNYFPSFSEEVKMAMVLDLKKQNSEVKKQIEEMKPKVEYVEKVLESKQTLTTTQIAKDYGMSAVKLNKILQELGVQYKTNGQWVLRSQYQEEGYMESITNCGETHDGEHWSKLSSQWTQKGRQFLYEKLRAIGYEPKCRIIRGFGKQAV